MIARQPKPCFAHWDTANRADRAALPLRSANQTTFSRHCQSLVSASRLQRVSDDPGAGRWSSAGHARATDDNRKAQVIVRVTPAKKPVPTGQRISNARTQQKMCATIPANANAPIDTDSTHFIHRSPFLLMEKNKTTNIFFGFLYFPLLSFCFLYFPLLGRG